MEPSLSNMPLIIDSGAYTAWRKDVPINFDEWISFCKKIQKKRPNTMFINLDVIPKEGESHIDTGEASYANWTRMREEGIDALPVYHPDTNEKWLKKYLDQTDFICLGGVARRWTVAHLAYIFDRIWEKHLVDENRMPKVKVHALGITSWRLLRRYPWRSIDSTAWIQAAGYGRVLVPRRVNGGWDYTAQPHVVVVTPDSIAKKQFGEHLENLPPTQQRYTRSYFEDVLGMPIGESKVEDGVRVIIEEGLENRHEYRIRTNAMFFARFTKALPWPRPLHGTFTRSAFQEFHGELDVV